MLINQLFFQIIEDHQNIQLCSQFCICYHFRCINGECRIWNTCIALCRKIKFAVTSILINVVSTKHYYNKLSIVLPHPRWTMPSSRYNVPENILFSLSVAWKQLLIGVLKKNLFIKTLSFSPYPCPIKIKATFKRKFICLQIKIQILDSLLNGEKVSHTGKNLNLNEATV